VARYVLMFRGESPPREDIDLIESSSGVRVLDRIERALLIDAPDETVQELRAQLADWVVADEVTYPPPGEP
jgi:hypothetical protein